MKKLHILFILFIVSASLSACTTNSGELISQALTNASSSSAQKKFLTQAGVSKAPVKEVLIEGYGIVLTDSNEKPLYQKKGDGAAVSTCYDECALTWPPLLVEASSDVSGDYKTLKRADGTLQVVFQDRPLYTYTPDGQNLVTGDGYKGIWDVVTVQGKE